MGFKKSSRSREINAAIDVIRDDSLNKRAVGWGRGGTDVVGKGEANGKKGTFFRIDGHWRA
jgi:hypothetical protein